MTESYFGDSSLRAMTDRSTVDRLLVANRYLVLGTADADGQPWVTPVCFAPLEPDRVCWVSSPDSRHSVNLTARAAVAITVFDSTVEVGEAEAAYFDADGAPLAADETAAALEALNARLPQAKRLSRDDLQPGGPMVVYQATLRHRYVLVRGGDPELGNAVDATVEVEPHPASPPHRPTPPTGPTPSRSGHLAINGLDLYFEVYGELSPSGPLPLLLVPGAFMATDSMPSWVSAFVGERAVVVFDQQGHGRTADTSRTMSYEQFADDAAALLGALRVERAHVVGYSQGGGVALQLALRHPTLVSKVVSMSATYRKDGLYPSVSAGIGGLQASAFAGTPVEKAFQQHTPDAAAFDAYVEKMKVLGINDQEMSDAQMSSISAKTMVIIGDADVVTPEHAVAMFKLRGGGDEDAAATGTLPAVPAARLVVLPATSHIGISAESAVLAPMVSAFLDDVPPATPDLFPASPPTQNLG